MSANFPIRLGPLQRFVAKALVLAGMVVSIMALFGARYGQLYPPANNYYLALLDKLRLLDHQREPRMVFVGGSSMAFGVDSAAVAEPAGYHPVNLGLHIGVGIDFMLTLIEPRLRSRDVVVLSFEYHAFETYVTTDPEIMARIVVAAPTLAGQLSLNQVKQVLDSGWLLHLGRVGRTAIGRSHGVLEFLNPLYQRGAFDQTGDFVGHHGKQAIETVPVNRFDFAKARQWAQGVSRINRFHAACEKRGITVLYVQPPYRGGAYAREAPAIRQLERELHARLQVPILDTSADAALPDQLFFDTLYHLTEQGKRLRSARLAALIADQLARQTESSPAKTPQ